jgi:hypothetical protein
MEQAQQSSGVKGTFHGYKLDDRRTDNYTFTSIKGLSRYFESFLDEEEIEEVIENAKIGFLIRGETSNEETKLQLIKKCEYALVRILRKGGSRG